MESFKNGQMMVNEFVKACMKFLHVLAPRLCTVSRQI